MSLPLCRVPTKIHCVQDNTAFGISPALFFSWCNSPLPPPPVGQGLLICETSVSHTDTPQSVVLLWTSDKPDGRPLPDNTQLSQATDMYEPGGIRTRNPSNQTAADSGPRKRGHWDQLLHHLEFQKIRKTTHDVSGTKSVSALRLTDREQLGLTGATQYVNPQLFTSGRKRI